MDDKFVKYSKLYLYIFLSIFAVLLGVALIISVFYGISKIISSGPVDILFELIVITVPATIFCTAYIIFFKRTKYHPSKPVKYISYVLFVLALCYCLFGLGWSIQNYFTVKSHSIAEYHTFSLLFLAGNVGLLFFIGIMQALTTEKEVDWMDRRKDAELE
jgi:hypothetical protein